jgi:hypothetical protein
MVGECLYVKTEFAMSAIAKGEKFAVLGHQSSVVFTATYAHNSVASSSYYQQGYIH